MYPPVLVFGYGVEGKSSEHFLQDQGYEVHIYDQKNESFATPPEWGKYSQIVASPGIDREKNIPKEFLEKTTSQLEILMDLLTEEQRLKTIGISGSKGKSGTTKLLVEALQLAGQKVILAGNYGLPVLDFIEQIQADDFDYLVMELSSFQLEWLERSPGMAIFTSFFPEHLDRHGDEAHYFEAKQNLWKHQNPTDTLIIPKVTFESLPEGSFPTKTKVSEPFQEDASGALDSPHLRSNFGAVKVLLTQLGIDSFEEALKRFALPPHRLELLGEKLEMSFYNDSISTNPHSVKAATDHFGENLGYLILGGQTVGGDFNSLSSKPFSGTVLLIKSPISELAQEWILSQKIDSREFQNLQEVMDYVAQNPKPGKIVLFSPGGKSFDQYPSYVARGEHFRTLFQSL